MKKNNSKPTKILLSIFIVFQFVNIVKCEATYKQKLIFSLNYGESDNEIGDPGDEGPPPRIEIDESNKLIYIYDPYKIFQYDWSGKLKKIIPYNKEYGAIYNIGLDYEGNLYGYYRKHSLCLKYNSKGELLSKIIFSPSPDIFAEHLVVDRMGQIWFGKWRNQVSVYNQEGNRIITYNIDNDYEAKKKENPEDAKYGLAETQGRYYIKKKPWLSLKQFLYNIDEKLLSELQKDSMLVGIDSEENCYICVDMKVGTEKVNFGTKFEKEEREVDVTSQFIQIYDKNGKLLYKKLLDKVACLYLPLINNTEQIRVTKTGNIYIASTCEKKFEIIKLEKQQTKTDKNTKSKN